MKNDTQHYWLITGKVMFRDPNMEGVGELTLNTVSRTKNKVFPSREIGRAQQAVQMQAFQKLQDETVQMVDVCIMSVSYLGHMTEEEFLKEPEGTVKRERGAPLNS